MLAQIAGLTFVTLALYGCQKRPDPQKIEIPLDDYVGNPEDCGYFFDVAQEIEGEGLISSTNFATFETTTKEDGETGLALVDPTYQDEFIGQVALESWNLEDDEVNLNHPDYYLAEGEFLGYSSSYQDKGSPLTNSLWCFQGGVVEEERWLTFLGLIENPLDSSQAALVALEQCFPEEENSDLCRPGDANYWQRNLIESFYGVMAMVSSQPFSTLLSSESIEGELIAEANFTRIGENLMEP